MNTDALKDFLSQLLNATPEMFCIACLIALGYALKYIPWVSNRFIPAILLVVSIACYPLIAENSHAPYTMRYPLVRQMMIGVVLWFIAWALHGLVIKRVVAYIKQRMDKFLPSGDTDIIDKPPPTGP